MQKRLNRVWVSGCPGEGSLGTGSHGGSPEVQGPSHRPGQEWGSQGDSQGSPTPGHHCGCHGLNVWGEGAWCLAMWAPRGLWSLLQPLGATGPRPSLRMQAWPRLASLPALVSDLRRIFLLNLTQIKLFSGTAGDTPSSRLN